jgi:hypothetical protein
MTTLVEPRAQTLRSNKGSIEGIESTLFASHKCPSLVIEGFSNDIGKYDALQVARRQGG